MYIAIDEDAERARTRMNAALEGIYGQRVPAIEAAAITGTAADCIREVNQVAAAGANSSCHGLVRPARADRAAGRRVLPKLR